MNKMIILLAGLMFAFANSVISEELLRDPTQPLGYQSGGGNHQSRFTLQAVFGKSGQVTKAIINGATLRVGESISGWEVTDIRPGKVVLQSDSAKQILHLRKSVTQ